MKDKDLMFCPTANCGEVLDIKNANKLKLACTKCKNEICVKCKQGYHGKNACHNDKQY